MKMCAEHWKLCREAIALRGLEALVSRDGAELVERLEQQLRSGDPAAPGSFDPLMSLNWHFMNEALRCGGLYVMGADESGANDGQYCPVCEFIKHQDGFVAEKAIGKIADQIAAWVREQGLIPKVN